MKRPTFEQTVDVLVKAYIKSELEHAVCSACAVGNLIAHSLGTRPRKNPDADITMVHSNDSFEDGTPVLWNKVFSTGQQGIQDTSFERCNGAVRYQIESTGYTEYELARMEYAFESAPGRPGPANDYGWWPGKSTDETWMFNGLMAVVDVLAEIHNVDLSVKENAKALFVKP